MDAGERAVPGDGLEAVAGRGLEPLIELRASVSSLRSDAAHADRALTEPGVTHAALRARTIKTAADTAAETVERVLPPAAGSR